LQEKAYKFRTKGMVARKISISTSALFPSADKNPLLLPAAMHFHARFTKRRLF
jgi:hypothetical protein